MDDMDVYGRLAAHSLLTSLALALATREDANPSDALKEVVDSMRGTVDVARKALPQAATSEHADSFVAAFNSELEHVQSMAATMLISMGAEQG